MINHDFCATVIIIIYVLYYCSVTLECGVLNSDWEILGYSVARIAAKS